MTPWWAAFVGKLPCKIQERLVDKDEQLSARELKMHRGIAREQREREVVEARIEAILRDYESLANPELVRRIDH